MDQEFISVIDENELEVNIRLDSNNRAIECDCTFLETDTVITLKRKELPATYNEFCRNLNSYVYEGNQFVLKPLEYEPSVEEKILAEQERQAKAIEELIILTLGG